MRVLQHKTQSKVTKEQVLACHALHPEWNAARIARELKCVAGYVRATLKRNGKTNPGTRKAIRPKKPPLITMRSFASARAAPAQEHQPPRSAQRSTRPYWID